MKMYLILINVDNEILFYYVIDRINYFFLYKKKNDEMT